MPIKNRISEMHGEITVWRRDFHENPELLYDTHRTSKIVKEKLTSFGCDQVITGLGRTGVVGVIHGRSNSNGKTIGLRADMDALPIKEITNLEYSSKKDGMMHACGHDGHTAMLLGAAKYLSETRNFDGKVVVIFQPAEEGGAGAKEMCEDGLMSDFDISEVYGMHNAPGLPVGQFNIRSGAFFAAADQFTVNIQGKGGHAARPQETIDPTIVGAHILIALQSVASRNTDPLKSLVVSVTSFRTESDSYNVIPQTVQLKGTVRTLSKDVRDMAQEKITQLIKNTGLAFGADVKLDYERGYPVMINSDLETSHMIKAAKNVAGDKNVDDNASQVMGAEDFSYMLEERPGAYIRVGNGNTASLHHPNYDFNDESIPFGTSFWVELTETRLPFL
ncbi:MAG: M20 family metallopeptidase [Paracoccaceae bacterium]|jgi:hippurate hydrolase|nr:M20 family metallopeptidase [Paracoccaceae bacterium]MDG1940643.1 M20 family metallopeptidase [Paracoccaceae bacterium]